ncbi:MAG: ion transporter [Gammaproteobacteria bacterium]|nr:ion transporter [Gammaproteobacteria bacterium]
MPLFQSVKTIIEDTSSPGGRVFGFCIQTLIIISIISFSMETLPDLSQGTHDLLRVIEIITVAIFSIEYLLRIVVVDKKSTFIFSFYGVVDLIAILPFYLTVGLDLRTLRIFRLLHLLRMLKLARYSRALDRMYRAFQLVRTDLALCMMAAMMFIYLSAVDIYPVTVGGRIFTFVILMIGLGIITISTGIMAAAMTRISQEDQAEADDK